jgi:hypothetical protein
MICSCHSCDVDRSPIGTNPDSEGSFFAEVPLEIKFEEGEKTAGMFWD